MIQSMKLRGAVMMLAMLGVAPETAFAEARWCVWTNDTTVVSASPSGTLRCYADAPCGIDIGCSEGRLCESGQCVPACTSIRLVDNTMGCVNAPPIRSGMPPRVETDDGRVFTPVGACTEPARSCGASWEEWEQGYTQVETSSVGTFRYRTSMWGSQDTDSDGCMDGADGTPCAPSEITACGFRFLPNSCGEPITPVGQCCVSGSRVECGDCAPNECSTVYACQPTSEFWSCPPLEGSRGVGACLRVEEGEPRLSGLSGYCLFPEFVEGCDLGELTDGDACFKFDGVPVLNFFAGDCDEDGCPNGYDAAPCTRCDGEACGTVSRDPRSTCPNGRAADTELDPSDCNPDAGTSDAGVATGDAGVASPMDTGIQSNTDTGPRPTFGGGGGCTCTASRSASHGSALLALGLALTCIARRRRTR